MLIRDYDFIHNIDVLFEKKIVIYGAGARGRKSAWLLEDTAVGFDCFCDKDVSKKQWLGHPIITIDMLQEKLNHEDYMIVISSEDHGEEMIEELDKREIRAYTCTWYGLQTGIELHAEDERFPEIFRRDFVQRKHVYTSFHTLYLRNKSSGYLCNIPHASIIYQSGKVGSTSLGYTFKKEKVDALQEHMFGPTTETETMNGIYSYFSNKYKSKGGKFITLVREPIARSLSLFMQCFDKEYIVEGSLSQGLEKSFKIRQCDENYDLGKNASKWMAEILDTNDEFLWFDKEIKVVTGIDIYQYPFDKEKGYAWIKEGNIEILVLKLEKLQENLAVIEDFVGKPGIELVRGNIGDEKWSKYIYEELKTRVKIPARLLDSQYKDNWQMDHFYTEEEKEKFRQKWSKFITEEEVE